MPFHGGKVAIDVMLEKEAAEEFALRFGTDQREPGNGHQAPNEQPLQQPEAPKAAQLALPEEKEPDHAGRQHQGDRSFTVARSIFQCA